MPDSASKKSTALIAAEEALRQLQGIVSSTMDGIISIDADERIILFNSAAEEMFGLSAEAAVGQHISQFMPERFRAGHSEHIAGFKNARVSTRRMGALGAISGLRTNGAEFPIEASISQSGSAGSTIATVILRDITERKANEDARELLAREVDHRAKNMLAVVQALLSLTQAPTKEAFIEAISGRVSALARAHSLLAQNRWEGAKLLQIIFDETALYRRPGQLEIEGLGVVLIANAVQPISLLLHELAINAFKYGALSVDTGRVAIRLSLVDGNQLELCWTEAGGPPVQEPGAAGFGTTLISQVAAQQLDATVDMRWPIEGLQLTLTLPASSYRVDFDRSRPAAERVKSTPHAAVGGLRVLVVEDETLVAMALCADLAARGWDVVGPAASVEEAVKILANAPSPDVAVLDVNLSGRLVYPLAEQLRAEGVPFIFCTGYERLDHHERFRNDAIFRKPVDMNLLTEQLRLLGAAA